MKVMICQPMKGLTDEEILETRRKIINRLAGVEVIDTLFDNVIDDGKDIAIYLLSKSIEAMSEVDLVIFASGWLDGRECRIEHEIASAYDKPMIEL